MSDITFALGVVTIIAGAAWIHPGLGLLVAGLLLAGSGLVLHFRKDDET